MTLLRSRNIGLFLAFASAYAVVPGCGADPPTNVVNADRFPSAYAQALCQSLQHCCAENQVPYDYTQCSTGWQKDIEARYFGIDTQYDPKRATSCVENVRKAANNPCEPSKGSVSDARDVCTSIFIGQKALGAQCKSAAECKPQEGKRVVCAATPGTVGDGGALPLAILAQAIPVCAVIDGPKAGEPCALMPGQPGVNDCGAELYCDPTKAQCQPRGQQGEACTPGSCAAGAYCAGVQNGKGLCATVASLGQPCGTADQCESTARCDLGGSKTCVPKKQPGEACADDSECSIGVCDATVKKCLKNGFATTAACNGKGY